jgi:hypothetical protein
MLIGGRPVNVRSRGTDQMSFDSAQAIDQFLATTKLAINKAICLKTKQINKSKMYF